jgi:hypothetical protein
MEPMPPMIPVHRALAKLALGALCIVCGVLVSSAIIGLILCIVGARVFAGGFYQIGLRLRSL